MDITQTLSRTTHHNQKRRQLQWRLQMARDKERNWPSARAWAAVLELEKELERIEAKINLWG